MSAYGQFLGPRFVVESRLYDWVVEFQYHWVGHVRQVVTCTVRMAHVQGEVGRTSVGVAVRRNDEASDDFLGRKIALARALISGVPRNERGPIWAKFFAVYPLRYGLRGISSLKVELKVDL